MARGAEWIGRGVRLTWLCYTEASMSLAVVLGSGLGWQALMEEEVMGAGTEWWEIGLEEERPPLSTHPSTSVTFEGSKKEEEKSARKGRFENPVYVNK